MRTGECFFCALDAAKKQPVRRLLTILGISVGIAVLTAVLSIGEAGSARVMTELKNFGIDRIVIYADGQSGFRTGDMEHVMERVSGISSVDGQSLMRCEAHGESGADDCEVTGTYGGIVNTEKDKLICGRFIDAGDVKDRRRVAVISASLADTLFGSQDACLRVFRLGETNFRVIGVRSSPEQIYEADTLSQVFIPITAFDDIFGGGIAGVSFEVDDKARIGDKVQEVTRALHERYPGKLSVLDLSEQMNYADEIMGIVRLIMAVVGALALLVGGIGIMNIMLVSVKERKKEIGLRKALGATNRDILRQFMLEALFYTILGGATGVASGLALTSIAEKAIGLESLFSGSSVLLALLFSAVTGFVSGVLPALKAARLDPVIALRGE